MTKSEYKNLVDYEVLKSDHYRVRGICLFKEIMLNPSRAAVYYVRKMQYYAGKTGYINSLIVKLLHVKLNKHFGMCISPDVKIGKGLHFPHPTGIVLGSASVIGENCSIYQNVTVGGARIGDAKSNNQPLIGDDVILFSGSMVLGSVKVADRVTLGANSVLLHDADRSGIYVGSPARRIGE